MTWLCTSGGPCRSLSPNKVTTALEDAEKEKGGKSEEKKEEGDGRD